MHLAVAATVASVHCSVVQAGRIAIEGFSSEVHCNIEGYCAVHYNDVHYSAVHYNAVHYSDVHYNTVRYSALHYNAVH